MIYSLALLRCDYLHRDQVLLVTLLAILKSVSFHVYQPYTVIYVCSCMCVYMCANLLRYRNKASNRCKPHIVLVSLVLVSLRHRGSNSYVMYVFNSPCVKIEMSLACNPLNNIIQELNYPLAKVLG